MVEATNTINTGIDWVKVIPIIISALTFLFNFIFYLRIKDTISFRYVRMSDLAKTGADFLAFLSEIESAEDFEGVPTKVKTYSERILLCFKKDENTISTILKELYHLARERKELSSQSDIKKWREIWRQKTSELQKALRKYCGVIR